MAMAPVPVMVPAPATTLLAQEPDEPRMIYPIGSSAISTETNRTS